MSDSWGTSLPNPVLRCRSQTDQDRGLLNNQPQRLTRNDNTYANVLIARPDTIKNFWASSLRNSSYSIMISISRGLLVSGLAILTVVPAAADRPNILWILTDDHSTDMGAYGTPAVSTPRMDQLASEGVLYHNAYTTSPVCSPSRTAMMTGIYQTSILNGMHHRPRPQSKQPLPGDAQPITTYFKQAGYFVADAKPDFNGQGKFDMNFANQDGSTLQFSDMFDGTDWRQAGTAPWFVQVNIFEPHRPFRFGNTDLTRRDVLELPGDLPDHPLVRADYADYLASIEAADAKVGAVLDRLEADGLADNTIVMFFGDNGREFTRAKGSGYDAGYRVPLVARIPEAYRQGRSDLAPGTNQHGLVSMLDVTAGSLAAAGIDLATPELDHLQGQDLLASGFTGRNQVFMAYDRGGNQQTASRTIRSGDLTYIRNLTGNPELGREDAHWYSRQERPILTLLEIMKARGLKTEADGLLYADRKPREELYDLSVDPHQLINLADDSAYASQLTQFRDQLSTWSLETNDLGGEPDPDLQPLLDWLEGPGKYKHLTDKGLPQDLTDYEYLEWWADNFEVPIDLPRGEFDRERAWVANASFERDALADGQWRGGTPSGWNDATGGVFVQNLTAAQSAAQAADGQNVLVLDSGGSEARWSAEDNWGNTLRSDEGGPWRLDVSAAVGRRSDTQGAKPGELRISLQTADGTIVVETLFDLTPVGQGVFDEQQFELLMDRATAAEYAGEDLFLAFANLAEADADRRQARVLLDELAFGFQAIALGDYNYDGAINQQDFALWAASYGSTTQLDADGNGDGVINAADYTVWRDAVGEAVVSVPEPISVAGASAIAALVVVRKMR